jgi:ribosomal protein L23
MGKMARRGRFEGRKPSWKKAYVTLKKGEKPVDYGEADLGIDSLTRCLNESMNK